MRCLQLTHNLNRCLLNVLYGDENVLSINSNYLWYMPFIIIKKLLSITIKGSISADV